MPILRRSVEDTEIFRPYFHQLGPADFSPKAKLGVGLAKAARNFRQCSGQPGIGTAGMRREGRGNVAGSCFLRACS